MSDEVKARIAELKQNIQKAQSDYYHGEPSVSDPIYDAWVSELQELEPDAPEVAAIGAPLPASSEWPKALHKIPMGSLDKVQTPEALELWFQKHYRTVEELVLLSEKMDGLSISVEYVQGRLVQAITRGHEGVEGEDITPNVSRMKGVLGQLAQPLSVILRGEIVLHKSDFQQYFPDKSNPRNAAAGTARRLDGQGAEHLTVYFYEVHGVSSLEREKDQFEWLQAQGFRVPQWFLASMESGKTPKDIWTEYQQTLREQLDYDIDGLVVRFDDLGHQQFLGSVNGRPKGARAFKFAAEARETLALGLELQVGGMGHVTPVAVLQPVRLVGAEVSRASLYNWSYIQEIGFHIGAKVLVTRANDVIPRVVSVTEAVGEPPSPPTTCPVCSYALEWEGEYLTCPNTVACPAQVEGRLKQWVSALRILEWGDVLIEKVVQLGVMTIPDLYRLTEARLASLERMGPSSAKKAYDQLWSVVPLPLESLVGALGIPLCATSTMELVVQAGFNTLEKLKNVTLADLQQIPGVGPKRAQSLVSWLGRNSSLLDDMVLAGIRIKAPIVGSLSGKSFCFTGKMVTKRPLLERQVKEAGGQVKDRVGKGLDYLVIADPNSASSKAVAARKNGTQCISEEAFLAMVGGV